MTKKKKKYCQQIEMNDINRLIRENLQSKENEILEFQKKKQTNTAEEESEKSKYEKKRKKNKIVENLKNRCRYCYCSCLTERLKPN